MDTIVFDTFGRANRVRKVVYLPDSDRFECTLESVRKMQEWRVEIPTRWLSRWYDDTIRVAVPISRHVYRVNQRC